MEILPNGDLDVRPMRTSWRKVAFTAAIGFVIIGAAAMDGADRASIVLEVGAGVLLVAWGFLLERQFSRHEWERVKVGQLLPDSGYVHGQCGFAEPPTDIRLVSTWQGPRYKCGHSPPHRWDIEGHRRQDEEEV